MINVYRVSISGGEIPSVDKTNCMKLLLYPITKRMNKRGHVPIYLRITINGQRIEKSTGVMVLPKHWSQAEQMVVAGPLCHQLNQKLQNLMKEALDHGPENIHLIKERKSHQQHITIERLIVSFLQYKESEVLAGVIVEDSYRSISTRIRNLIDTLNLLQLKNELCQNITKNQVKCIFTELRRKYGHNYTLKIIQLLKSAYEHCEQVAINPVSGFKFRYERKRLHYNTESELWQLVNYNYTNDKFRNVAIAYYVQSYTGMCYADLEKFNSKYLREINNTKFLCLERQKTKSISIIPIMPEVIKYLDSELIIYSNQKYSEYIKIAAELAGIANAEQITTLTARRTCGMILLSRGVKIGRAHV